MTPVRERAATLAVVAGGALVALGAATATWLSADVDDGLQGVRRVAAPGRDLAPALPAAALAVLVAALALVAARGATRVLVAALSVLAAGGGAVAVLTRTGPAAWAASVGADPATVTASPWPWPALGGLLLAGAAAAWAGARGGRWAGLGRRFERSAVSAHPDPLRSAWDALDRGEDPTAAPAPPAADGPDLAR